MSSNTTSDLFKNNKFNNEKINQIERINNGVILVLHTKSGIYFTDKDGIVLSGSENWIDYFIEPFTGSFYRKDVRAHWFDVEGNRVFSKVFILHDVLCSLFSKKSIQSLAFIDQPIYASRYEGLFQVGKLVYNRDLLLMNYFGERITALGDEIVKFHSGHVAQQVQMGSNRMGFMLEGTLQPLAVDNQDLSTHLMSKVVGHHHYELFQSSEGTIVYDSTPDNIVEYEGRPARLDLHSIIHLHDKYVGILDIGISKLSINLDSLQPFRLPCYPEDILEIRSSGATVDNRYFNIVHPNGQSVYDAEKQTILTLEPHGIVVSNIHPLEGFEKYWATININNQSRIMSLKMEGLLIIDDITIASISGKYSDKLINATTDTGAEVVLDLRKGISAVSIAMIGDQSIIKVEDDPLKLGDHIIQKAHLSTVGGYDEKIIDINQPVLAIFTLPEDLLEYQEQDNLSAFAGNEIVAIDRTPIQLNEHTFLSATIKTYAGEKTEVLIHKKNGKPIHIDGAGHRNELISRMPPGADKNIYRIGPYELVEVETITEDLKKEKLLMEGHKLLSWLPFYDTYLPILCGSIVAENATEWPSRLFELRETSDDKAYIAVENQRPFRILINNSKDILRPKIILSNEKVLKTPEQFSTLKRIFLSDPGYLIEVE